MKRQILIALIAALTGLVPKINTFEAQTQTSSTKRPTIYYVVGSDWHSCGDWKDWSEQMKLGFALGHAEGISQVMTRLVEDPHSLGAIQDAFSSSANLKFGELIKAVDSFCSDYRNGKIPVVNAMMVVSGDIAGFPPHDEKEMRHLRCVAAAGNDQSKIRDCSNQP